MKKRFDCVQMKNEIQAAMYADMKEMSTEKQLEYIRVRAEEFWKKVGRSRPGLTSGRREVKRV